MHIYALKWHSAFVSIVTAISYRRAFFFAKPQEKINKQSGGTSYLGYSFLYLLWEFCFVENQPDLEAGEAEKVRQIVCGVKRYSDNL